MSDPDRLKEAWKEGPEITVLPDLTAVRDCVRRLHQRTRQRKAIALAACSLAILCFTIFTLLPLPAILRIGSAMVVAGTLIAAWQLHRRISPVLPPDHAAAQPILLYLRAQLFRQRDAIASIFTWYHLPLLPGLLVILLGSASGERTTGVLGIGWPFWILLVTSAAVFTGAWLVNRRGAQRLQAWIEEIDALIGGGE